MHNVKDTTKLKKSEEKLIAAQILLQSSIESLKDVSFISIDRHYQYLNFNKVHKQRMSDLYGKDVKIGMNLLDCITLEDDRRRATSNFDCALAGESHITIEEFGDIEHNYYETRYNPIFDDKNVIIGATAWVIKITERIEAEKRINEMAAMAASSTDAIVSKTLDGNIVTWNKGAENMFGYTLVEVKGKHISVLIPEELRQEEAEIVKRIRQGELIKNYETTRLLKDGRTIHVSVNLSPIKNKDGTITGISKIVRDITESKQAEEKLKKSLKEISDYQYALDESSIVAITDQKGIIKFANDNFCEISKYSREELLGQDHRIINSGFHPKEFIRDLWVTIANGEVWRGELKNKAKDGTIYWVDTTIVPFLNEQGKPYQYVAIRSDITERKKKETEIQNLNKELESFSYSISHDLRAPLRALDGFAHALSEKYKDKLDEDGERWLDFISTNAKQMDWLINDMLNFSHLSRENVKGRWVIMKALAQECFESCKIHYPGKNLTFNLENIPDSFGDVAMVRQVWQNLISNALKYSSKNENITIGITGRIENDYTVYSIKDNGVGFDEKYKDKLFGVFQRLHSSMEYEGTGVGLAIVDRIIQKHNGWIKASSQLGKGAEFVFALPVQYKTEKNN